MSAPAIKHVADLDGEELDYWVALAEGYRPSVEKFWQNCPWKRANDSWGEAIFLYRYEPHKDCVIAWPIIERYQFFFYLHPEGDGQRGASLVLKLEGELPNYKTFDYLGQTYLVAAMRCVVASVYGDTVSVPDPQ